MLFLGKSGPFYLAMILVNAFFFTYYGPENYAQDTHEGRFLRKISNVPKEKVVYVRLRINVRILARNGIIDALTRILEIDQKLVRDFEILQEYDVLDDLGKRFCKNEQGIIVPERTSSLCKVLERGLQFHFVGIGRKRKME